MSKEESKHSDEVQGMQIKHDAAIKELSTRFEEYCNEIKTIYEREKTKLNERIQSLKKQVFNQDDDYPLSILSDDTQIDMNHIDVS